MLKLKRRILTLTADNDIGLLAIDHRDDSAVWIWGVGVLMATSITAGVLLLISQTPLGVYASIPGVGMIVGGFTVGLHLLASFASSFCHWQDERSAQNHVQTIAALKRRQMSIQIATVAMPPVPTPTVIRYASGREEVLQAEPATLIDPAAAECKSQALKWLSDSEHSRADSDRADKVVRWDKMGWSPEAWTRVRDSLAPLVESNPAGMPKGTYCVASAFLTVSALYTGVEQGIVLPSPSGAVVLSYAPAT